MCELSLEILEGERPDALIYRCIAGSRAYGTYHQASDTDIRGIYVLPGVDYLKLEQPKPQIADEKGDTVYYSLRRFIELAASANPNIIELLFMPDDCVLVETELMFKLRDNRELFLSKIAYESHVGYARAQIKKARGRNKWVNNPQPETAPAKESFCWIIPREGLPGNQPFRPVKLSESDVDLGECHCSALEHASSCYRLYHFGSNARGVFRKENLVCECIALEDERRCVGVLLYNQVAYERALQLVLTLRKRYFTMPVWRPVPVNIFGKMAAFA